MSSKRGRKRNDSLPPNRARDVQRAFRARRAAHLLALEQRVSDLEMENCRLRKMVGWPPDDRPPLGKGPTGKDKPKSFDSTGAILPVDFYTSRNSQSPVGESESPRTGSISPCPIPTSSSQTMQVIDGDGWENALAMSDPNDHQSDVGSSGDSSYQIGPLSAPVSSKAMYSPYGPSYSSSSSRHSLPPLPPHNMYPNSSASYSNSPHSYPPERQMSAYSSPGFVIRGVELRDEAPRQHYSYSPTPYTDPNIPPESPSLPSSAPTLSHSHFQQQRDTSISLTHRRSFPEQYSVTQGISHLSNSGQLHQNLRQSETHRVQDNNLHSYRVTYGPDGRISSVP